MTRYTITLVREICGASLSHRRWHFPIACYTFYVPRLRLSLCNPSDKGGKWRVTVDVPSELVVLDANTVCSWDESF